MKTCEIPGCKRRALARDMCPGHYQRWQAGKRGSELAAPLREYHPTGAVLNEEETELVWMLLYNICSQGDWPVGLDVPNCPHLVLEKYEKLLERLAPKE